MFRIILLAVLGPLLATGCFFGGGGDEGTDSPQVTQGPGVTSQPTFQPSLPTPTSTPNPTVPPTPSPEPPTSTPVTESAGVARNLVWAHLGKCFSLKPTDLEAIQVTGGWVVGAVAESPVEYGLWQVDPATGALQPHDVLADKIVTVLDSRCSDESLATLYAPTPISTETPIPESTPVVASGDQARHVVWVHLSQCLTFDAALLVAQSVDLD